MVSAAACQACFGTPPHLEMACFVDGSTTVACKKCWDISVPLPMTWTAFCDKYNSINDQSFRHHVEAKKLEPSAAVVTDAPSDRVSDGVKVGIMVYRDGDVYDDKTIRNAYKSTPTQLALDAQNTPSILGEASKDEQYIIDRQEGLRARVFAVGSVTVHKDILTPEGVLYKEQAVDVFKQKVLDMPSIKGAMGTFLEGKGPTYSYLLTQAEKEVGKKQKRRKNSDEAIVIAPLGVQGSQLVSAPSVAIPACSHHSPLASPSGSGRYRELGGRLDPQPLALQFGATDDSKCDGTPPMTPRSMTQDGVDDDSDAEGEKSDCVAIVKIRWLNGELFANEQQDVEADDDDDPDCFDDARSCASLMTTATATLQSAGVAGQTLVVGKHGRKVYAPSYWMKKLIFGALLKETYFDKRLAVQADLCVKRQHNHTDASALGNHLKVLPHVLNFQAPTLVELSDDLFRNAVEQFQFHAVPLPPYPTLFVVAQRAAMKQCQVILSTKLDGSRVPDLVRGLTDIVLPIGKGDHDAAVIPDIDAGEVCDAVDINVESADGQERIFDFAKPSVKPLVGIVSDKFTAGLVISSFVDSIILPLIKRDSEESRQDLVAFSRVATDLLALPDDDDIAPMVVQAFVDVHSCLSSVKGFLHIVIDADTDFEIHEELKDMLARRKSRGDSPQQRVSRRISETVLFEKLTKEFLRLEQPWKIHGPAFQTALVSLLAFDGVTDDVRISNLSNLLDTVRNATLHLQQFGPQFPTESLEPVTRAVSRTLDACFEAAKKSLEQTGGSGTFPRASLSQLQMLQRCHSDAQFQCPQMVATEARAMEIATIMQSFQGEERASSLLAALKVGLATNGTFTVELVDRITVACHALVGLSENAQSELAPVVKQMFASMVKAVMRLASDAEDSTEALVSSLLQALRKLTLGRTELEIAEYPVVITMLENLRRLELALLSVGSKALPVDEATDEQIEALYTATLEAKRANADYVKQHKIVFAFTCAKDFGMDVGVKDSNGLLEEASKSVMDALTGNNSKALVSLQAVCGGSLEGGGKSWRGEGEAAITASMPYNAVLAVAEGSLLKIDVSALQSSIGLVTRKLTEYGDKSRSLGLKSEWEGAAAALKQANVTLHEHVLFSLYSGTTDKQVRRSTTASEIAKMKANRVDRTADVLPQLAAKMQEALSLGVKRKNTHAQLPGLAE